MTIADDVAARSLDIHWPAGFSPEHADMFAHNEIVINAPRSAVWRILLAAEDWPQWYPNSHNVRILDEDAGGLLTDSVQFSWQTFGFDLVSTIAEIEPEVRIGWRGGTDWYHTWYLQDHPAGTLVIMEEVGRGTDAATMADTTPDRMHRGHELWNQCLKWASEEA